MKYVAVMFLLYYFSAVKRNKGNKQSSIMAAVKRKMQPVTRVSNGPNKSFRWEAMPWHGRTIPRIFCLWGQALHTFTEVSQIQTGFLVTFAPTQKVASNTFMKTNHTDAFCHELLQYGIKTLFSFPDGGNYRAWQGHKKQRPANYSTLQIKSASGQWTFSY